MHGMYVGHVPTTQSVIRSLLVMDCSVQDSRCATTQEQANPANHIGPARTAEWLRRGRQVGQSAVLCPLYWSTWYPPCHRSVSVAPVQSAATCGGHLSQRARKGPRPHSEPDDGKHRVFVVVACCDYTIPCTLLVGPGSLARCMPQTKPGESARSTRSSVFCSLR